MIRLLILDDHPIVSSGLAARYETMPGFSVVGTAATVPHALRLSASSAVDVAVVDIQLDTTLTPRQVGVLVEHCKVVLFSARSTEAHVRTLLDAGASAALDKSASLPALDEALRRVHAGQKIESSWDAATNASVDARLSQREHAVYRALVSCKTPKEVAATLGIAPSTVYCHIENIRRKLGVHTLQELVARAYADLGVG